MAVFSVTRFRAMMYRIKHLSTYVSKTCVTPVFTVRERCAEKIFVDVRLQVSAYGRTWPFKSPHTYGLGPSTLRSLQCTKRRKG
jgi:hypothetical protein